MNENLFPTLTRDDAIEIQQAWGFGLINPRKPQVAALEEKLQKRGAGYVAQATFELLETLASYGNVESGIGPFDYPVCVYETYRAMFKGLDEFLNDLVGDRFEVESWDGPIGSAINSVTCYDIKKAKQEYLEWLKDEKYVRLLKVDKNGEIIKVIAASF